MLDRPDLSDLRAPLNSRAVVTPSSGSQSCATGYRNPDTGLCVSPGDVHWIQGLGLPNASTVGRNTLLAGGINNFDLTLTKSFPIGEQASRVSLGSVQRIEPSAVHSDSGEKCSRHAAGPLPQSGFHR